VVVVDCLVAAAPRQLLRALVTERRERGGVREPDHSAGIDDPDRLRRGFQHGGEKILGIDIGAGQVDQGIRHVKKPPSTVQFMASRPAGSMTQGAFPALAYFNARVS
jgi:hypothetical protein